MKQLEYYKTVLQKVSFDKSLFNKEYAKAMRELSEHDKHKLVQWCTVHFKRNEWFEKQPN